MNREEFLERCKREGLEFCQLTNIDQFKRVFNLDVTSVKGYKALTGEEKKKYEQFILNYFNAMGVDRKLEFKPVSVWNCIQKDYSMDGYKIGEEYIRGVAGAVVDSWTTSEEEIEEMKNYDEDRIENDEITTTTTEYLRFDYKLDGTAKWLHVKNGNEWY